MYNTAISNILKVGFEDKIEVVHADANEYLFLLKENDTYDVVFIDAAKGQYLKYLEHAMRLVKKRWNNYCR